MAKQAIDLAYAEELKNDKVAAAADNKFNSTVRNMDAGDPLMVGDRFTIPADAKVLTIKLSDDETRKPVPFILVEVKNKETGAEKNTRFFPNQLCKVAYPIDESGRRLGKAKTKGTATEQYKQFNDVDTAVASLVGKTIEVTKDTTYTVESFGTHDRVNTHIYQYDFVEA